MLASPKTPSSNGLLITGVPGTEASLPASSFTGIDPIASEQTRISFKALTGNKADDDILLTHDSGKFKEFAQELTDIIADDSKVKGLTVVRDDMRDINLTVKNVSGISAVAQTATAS